MNRRSQRFYPRLYKEDNDNKPPDAILISHSHPDHYGLLPFVKPQIPLYLSEGCLELIKATYYFRGLDSNLEAVEIIENNKCFSIGDFKIIPYLVDHSGFDAYAFLIEAEGKRIFYSGDFRGHGKKRILFDRFIANPPKDIGFLIMEGTGIEGKDGQVFVVYSDINRLEQHMMELAPEDKQVIEEFTVVE